MKTNYLTFYYRFKDALHTKKLDNYLIYDDEIINWFDECGFIDLYEQAKISLCRRNYPSEIETWVKETLKYLYDDIEKVDASVKHIPSFLLKNGSDT